MNKVQLLKIRKTLEEITSIIEDSSSDYKIFQEKFNSPEKFTEYAVKRIGKKQKENLLVCYLNTKYQMLHSEIVSIGTINSAMVHPREVFRNAIKLNSFCVIVAHNHPSGDLTPSEADVTVARRLIEVGKIIGIEVLDNLVVNKTSGVSVRL